MLPRITRMSLVLSVTQSMIFGYYKTVLNTLIGCFIPSDNINFLSLTYSKSPSVARETATTSFEVSMRVCISKTHPFVTEWAKATRRTEIEAPCLWKRNTSMKASWALADASNGITSDEEVRIYWLIEYGSCGQGFKMREKPETICELIFNL